MTPKAKVNPDELCVEKEVGIDLVGMTTGLIENMTKQMKRLKEGGYDTTKVEKAINRAKTGLKATKRRLGK